MRRLGLARRSALGASQGLCPGSLNAHSAVRAHAGQAQRTAVALRAGRGGGRGRSGVPGGFAGTGAARPWRWAGCLIPNTKSCLGLHLRGVNAALEGQVICSLVKSHGYTGMVESEFELRTDGGHPHRSFRVLTQDLSLPIRAAFCSFGKAAGLFICYSPPPPRFIEV